MPRWSPCPEQAARLVFVTGGATRDTHEIFLPSTALPCLYKQFDIDAVRQVVQDLVGRDGQSDEATAASGQRILKSG